MPTTSKLIYRSAALVGAAGIVLAACGSGSSTKNAAPTTTAAAPSTTAASATTVMTKADPKLGTILADGQGLTLYTLTNSGQAVPCTGGCAAVWPPLALPAGMASATAGPGVSGLGVATATDGTRLVTAGGLPLYRFSKDKDSGDAYGEGLQSFGGIWHVVKAGASASATTAAPAATTPRTTAAYRAPTTTSRSGMGGY
jgi:predicted lipoprotein with Yx(FWY)xxD motif